jgi:signal transduction histidine kinase
MSKVRVSLDLGENLPPIDGNANQLQQVLLNLAINAQQAMPQGGKVNIATRYNGNGYTVIEFSDNGPGMPETVKQKIFEPFFSTKTPGQSTGLGMAISFGIIRDHKGSIQVESEVGQGAKFIIHIPTLDERA